LNFVFDLGGVLVNYDPKRYVQKIVGSDKAEILKNIIFDSPEWIELDKGTLDESEAVRIWGKKNPEYSQYIELIMKNWDEMLTPKYENIRLLKPLKNMGHKLYILSNFHEEAFKNISEKYSFFGLFNGMVISYKEKTVKPEERIYRVLIKRYGINPSDTVFIDDSMKNIETAERLGFKAFLYVKHSKLIEFLSKLLGGAIIEA